MYISNVNHDKTWQMFGKIFLKQVKKYPELSLCWTKWQKMSDSFAATVYKVEGMH